MSTQRIQTLSPDFGRSRKMIEGVFPIFCETRFSTSQMAKQLKMLEFVLGVLKLPEGAL